MLVGYMRISTADQNLDLQEDALRKEGCEKIFADAAGGTDRDRPGLAEALNHLRPGDTLVVWKLDRLGRSLKHLIEIVEQLNCGGISFKSLHEHLDTTTSGGKLIFSIFGALAEFERELILERTHAGIKAARARGRIGGRKPKLDAQGIELFKKLAADPQLKPGEICRILGISHPTFYRYQRAIAQAAPSN